MPLLDRDMLRAFLQVFAAMVSLILLMILITTLLDYYQFVFGEGQSRIGWVLFYFLLTVPGQALYILPVSTAVATLWVLGQKARTNELLAYFCCGVRPMRIARPFVAVALVIALLGMALHEYIATPALAQAHRVERVFIKQRPEASLTRNTDIVLRVGPSRYLRVDAFDAATRGMDGPTIIDLGPGADMLRERIDAESALYVDEGRDSYWRFNQVRRWVYDDEGTIVSFDQLPSWDTRQLNPPLDPSIGQLLETTIKPSRMTHAELSRYLAALEQNGRHDPVLRTELWLKLSLPLLTMVLGLLAAAHGVRPSHAGVLVSLGGGLIWMVSVFAVTIMCRTLGHLDIVPAQYAAWIPHGLFSILGVGLLIRSRFA